jgi:hypothetical protein
LAASDVVHRRRRRPGVVELLHRFEPCASLAIFGGARCSRSNTNRENDSERTNRSAHSSASVGGGAPGGPPVHADVVLAPQLALDQRALRVGPALELRVDVGEVAGVDPEHPQRLARRPEVDHPPLGHEQHVVALLDVGGRVRDHHDRAPGVGQAAQRVHHLLLEPRVEAAGRLVEEEQARVGQQLGRDRHALALPARQLEDVLVAVRRHLDVVEHAGDAGLDLAGRRVRRQPQLGAVGQRLVDAQAGVQDVVLRHVAEHAAVRVEVL